MAASAEASNSSAPYYDNKTDFFYECYDIPYAKKLALAIPLIASTVGLPPNMWLLFLLVKSLWVGTVTSDIFAINAACIQTLLCLAYPLTAAGTYFRHQGILLFTLLISGFVVVGWSQFQSITCVMRYLAVVHPLVFLKIRAPKYLKYRVMCCVAIWLAALSFSSVLMLWNPEFPVQVLIAPFITLLVLNTFCSISIMRALKRPAPGNRERDGMHKRNREAFKMVLITQLMVTLNFLPFICTGFMKNEGYSYEQVCIGYAISTTSMGFTTIVQPLISLSRMPKSQLYPCLSQEQTG